MEEYSGTVRAYGTPVEIVHPCRVRLCTVTCHQIKIQMYDTACTQSRPQRFQPAAFFVMYTQLTDATLSRNHGRMAGSTDGQPSMFSDINGCTVAGGGGVEPVVSS